MNCINIKSPEFIKLLEDSNMSSFELEIYISSWQDSNNTDEFPSVNQVKRFGEIQYQKQTASTQNQPFDKKLHKKIENKLKKLYPEIKLEYSNNPSWVKDSNVFNQKSQLDNEINYRLKAVDILLSDKAKQVFAKGES